LLKRFKKATGRNNSGKITVRHMGGGFKAKELLIDYSRFL
jgi:ribosomal protein L2